MQLEPQNPFWTSLRESGFSLKVLGWKFRFGVDADKLVLTDVRPCRRRLRSRLPRAAADRAPSALWSEQILVAQLSKSRVSTSVINNATKGKRLARNSALPSATLQGGSFRRR